MKAKTEKNTRRTKPKLHQEYYFIHISGVSFCVGKDFWLYSLGEVADWKNHNVFLTRKEAQKKLMTIKKVLRET